MYLQHAAAAAVVAATREAPVHTRGPREFRVDGEGARDVAGEWAGGEGDFDDSVVCVYWGFVILGGLQDGGDGMGGEV